jgi:hypothetical protein
MEYFCYWLSFKFKAKKCRFAFEALKHLFYYTKGKEVKPIDKKSRGGTV